VTTTTDRSPLPRSSGILLHPTSLPGPFGIGDLGPAAFTWVDALARARQSWWQILPLGVTGYGNSPYQSYSAFGGNPYLISPELLVREGLLTEDDLGGVHLPEGRVDFHSVHHLKTALLSRAWDNFTAGRAPGLREHHEAFRHHQAGWLDDFTLFMALKEARPDRPWMDWEEDLVLRRPEALARARREYKDAIARHEFGQFLFYRQWWALKNYASEKGVRLIGDVPIFVSIDSADVWANPGGFKLDQRRRPTVVAGVPPDYFSETGQLWGNPLYDWEAMKRDGFAWWVARLRAMLDQVDLVRLDHFRGFEACWEIPADAPTAESGQWVPAPGDELIATLEKELGQLPLIAEDLGLITPEVEALRDRFELPGMVVLHFAFYGDPKARYLPHNHIVNSVVYTGTHDNDTTLGWFRTRPEEEATFLRRYLPHVEEDPCWEMIRLTWSSVASLALIPLQDLLGLGNEARMNLPGQPEGNWAWRYHAERLTDAVLDRLADMTEVYGRCATSEAEE
jgi:4-alpha-glucanotransferase